MHGNDNQEYLPEDAKNCKGLAGNGHIREGAADVKRQQRDDNIVEYFVNDGGEILHCIVQGITDLFSTHGREAQAQDESQDHCGQGVHDRLDGDGEVRGQRDLCGSSNLVQRVSTHKARKQAFRNQERCGTCDQGRAVSQGHGDEQEFSCALGQVCDTHGNVSQDHERDDEF